MTVNEIISALEKIQAEDPKRFYDALGYGDQGVNVMNMFISGSYELGLVAGALWMQEQMMSEAVEGEVFLNPYPTISLDDCKDYDFKEGDKVRVIIVKEDKK